MGAEKIYILAYMEPFLCSFLRAGNKLECLSFLQFRHGAHGLQSEFQISDGLSRERLTILKSFWIMFIYGFFSE